LEALNLALTDVRIAVIGPKTAAVVEELLSLEVELVAHNYTAEGLARALQPVAGLHFLLPQSEIARPVLAQALRDHGAEATTIVAYRTVLGQGGADVPGLLADEEIDAITFSSSSTARNFLTRLENEGGSRRHLDGVCLAAIGPITASTMASLDLPVTLTPEEFTLPSLVAALDAYFRSETKRAE
jgi:uroporphyrinogen III methyltransferase/synthase